MRGSAAVRHPPASAAPRAGQVARRLAGCLLVATAAAAAPATVLGYVVGPLHGLGARLLRGTVTHAGLETVVVEAASLALVVGSCWVVLLVLAGLTEALTGTAPALLASLTPVVVRRTVALACGAALGTTAVVAPAVALDGGIPPRTESAVPVDVSGKEASRGPVRMGLTGLALPDRATGSAGPASVTVRLGDSLWSVAQDLLPGAGNEQIDRAWRALYAANRSALGPDPDVVYPGTSLRVPGGLSERRREACPGHQRSHGPDSPDDHQQPREEAP